MTLREAGVTKEDLRQEVEKAFEYVGYPEEAVRVEEVRFNNRLKSAGARVGITQRTRRVKFIEFNPALSIDELTDCARHEVLHVITGASDGDPYFEEMARKHDIPLHVQNELASVEKFKYHIRCNGCGKVIAKYKRKGKYIKLIEKGDKRVRCSGCGSNELTVKELV